MKQRLVGLVACLVLAAILIGLPAVLVGLGWAGAPTTWEGWRLLVTRPDDGTLLVVLIKIAGWASWAILAGLCLVEILAIARGVQPITLPGLRWSQLPLRRLVAAAALLFVLPTVIATTQSTPAAADSTARQPHHTSSAPVEKVAEKPADHSRDRKHTSSYTVKPGDSLWAIAEKVCGGGEKYTEIVALNRGLLGNRPDFLRVGWELIVPDHTSNRDRGDGNPSTEHDDQEPDRYTVRKGDTLREIAHDRLGDEERYPEIFEASRHIVQPGGYRLTDPDKIDIGWTLKIPGKTAKDRARVNSTRPVPPERTPAGGLESSMPLPTHSPASIDPQPDQPSVTPTQDSDRPNHSDHAPEESNDSGSASWLVAGLVGSGTMLGGALLMLLRRRRQAQFRARRPGRTIAPPPAAVAPVERTLITEGPKAAPVVTDLDAALRNLGAAMSASGSPMPQLLAVELNAGRIRLHLDQPADLPGPWEMIDPSTWNLDGADTTSAGAGPAPYPLLVSVGQDTTGTTWLLNTEQLGTLWLTGDPANAHNYARYLVAEMATLPWAGAVRVECIGLAAEAADLEPSRVRHHTTCDDAVEEALSNANTSVSRANSHDVDAATGRAGDVGDDTWPTRMMLVAAETINPAGEKLMALNTSQAGRTGTAVVVVGGAAPDEHLTFTFAADGIITAADWGLTVTSAGLTLDEVHGCAVLLNSCEADDVPIPPCEPGAASNGHCDEAGALLADQVLPRSLLADELPEPADRLISATDADVMAVAAATPDDLQTLAPWVPVRVREAVAKADPNLDADLAAWRSDSDLHPRVWLLGPIKARTSLRGNPLAVKQRRAFYTELLAFLALRPSGATTEQLCDAFSMEAGTVRKHMGVIRDWLRTNPDGGKHLPDATESPAGKARGIGVYQLQGVLLDVDLFLRLRQRGESRGPDGVKDLTDALSLVTGEPFEGQRHGGWGWLVSAERVDQHMLCGVIDVAHLVVTACLHSGNLATARAAAEIAVRAAPYDDIPRLDLAAVTAAEGDQSEAIRIVTDEVCNRHVDGEAPMDLSLRSAQVVSKPRWLSNGQVA